MDINGVLHENSAASFRAACRRWACGYHVVRETPPEARGLHPMHCRLWMWELLPDARRVFYLDADTVVRADCPSPFHTFPDEGLLYAVKDGSPRFDNWRDLRREHERAVADMRRVLGVTLDPDRYFNSGVMLLSRRAHHAELRDVRRAAMAHPEVTFPDQSYLNVVARRAGLELIPETWNYIQPQEFPVMSHWVYHFAGYARRRQRLLPQADWARVPPAPDSGPPVCVRRVGGTT